MSFELSWDSSAEPVLTPKQVDAWNLYSVGGLRGYARRRGYKIRKLRGQDRFALVDVESGDITVAREHGATVAECYFTRAELRSYLADEPLR